MARTAKRSSGTTVKLKTIKTAPTKPATAKASAPQPKVVGAEPGEDGIPVRKADLIDKAVDASGIKKRDAKPAIEAALAELARLLAEGHDVNLPPLGKIRVVKSRPLDQGAQVLTLKLRTPKIETPD